MLRGCIALELQQHQASSMPCAALLVCCSLRSRSEHTQFLRPAKTQKHCPAGPPAAPWPFCTPRGRSGNSLQKVSQEENHLRALIGLFLPVVLLLSILTRSFTLNTEPIHREMSLCLLRASCTLLLSSFREVAVSAKWDGPADSSGTELIWPNEMRPCLFCLRGARALSPREGSAARPRCCPVLASSLPRGRRRLRAAGGTVH